MLATRVFRRCLLALAVIAAGTGSCRRRDEPVPTPAESALPAARRSEPSRQPAPSAELVVPAGQTYRVTPLAPGEKRPLLLVLHGLGGSGRSMFEAFGLSDFGAAERVHVLAPDGTSDSAGRRFWNAGSACCNFERRPIDDVARIAALLRAWSEQPGVDGGRLYVVGYSNGGFMAHRLACELGRTIAGIASLAGAVSTDLRDCTPNPELAVLAVHGDADEKVRHSGGTVFDDPRIGRHLSAEQGLGAWGAWLGCSGGPKPGPPLDLEPALPGPETLPLTLSGCRTARVALWTVRGAGHGLGAPARLLTRVWAYLSARSTR